MYFAKEVMPKLVLRLQATFRVVGQIRDEDAAKLRELPHVEVTGKVDSIADAVAEARVGVCPVRLAAGVQNKVLEYMAIGLPVVTSQIGLEGFAAHPEKDLLVANTPEEYVNQIERIWNDVSLRYILGQNGKAYVENHHNWSARLQPMVDRVARIIENQGNISDR